MSLELVAAHAFSNLGSANMFAPRDLANVGTVEARAESGNDTVNIFIDSEDPTNYEYAASVVAACASETVYEVFCTAGPDSRVCGDDTPGVTITENASEYKVTTATKTTSSGIAVEATVIENCALESTTSAACTATVVASAQGQKYTTDATTTYANPTRYWLDVQVTGGNEKLANPTGTCESAASGVNTRAVAFWGFLGAVGAVGVLAL
ncbi:hypothetical protein EKO27_g11489 [Xylaria grammica]|uniref:Uncharacterized protein n=1 Tax=Xylaria grammica TaxID=363999 RepID=A0A439CNG0_9PEZI|nr:hypothetical protein EKO27_g11489 [Xylaria grammica]